MKKNKIPQYLKAKFNQKYTILDTALKKYKDQSLYKLFSMPYSEKIEIFPCISNKGNNIEFCWICNNIASNILLFDDKIEYSIYNIDDCIDDSNFETIMLQDYLSFEMSIDMIYKKMIKHPSFNSNYSGHNKRKIYRMLSNICLTVMTMFIGVISIYVFATGTSFKLDFIWVLLFVILPLIGCILFHRKSLK